LRGPIEISNMERRLIVKTGFVQEADAATPVYLIGAENGAKERKSLPEREATFAKGANFKGQAGQLLYVADDKGAVSSVLYGIGDGSDAFVVAGLSASLSPGTYELVGLEREEGESAAFAWALGSYSFSRYSKEADGRNSDDPKLVMPEGVDAGRISNLAKGAFLARDLVNTPASDMGPEELAHAAQSLADEHGATCKITVGDDLLKDDHFMIHAVGRASPRAPRLIDIYWGEEGAPKVTLVGKGVCFDTGGLNLKPGESMALMKKDMGGAANVLGLASMIMGAGLNIRLRVLVPAVENSVAGNSYRPGDVLKSRKGLSVEIGNTDAEGRLVLGDALALGCEENPDLIIDMATLTGAARVALGPDLPPFYTDDDGFAGEVLAASAKVHDPVWRMPLWKPYLETLKSPIADISHISQGGFGGSITAALFLQKFISSDTSWAHFDIFSWNPKVRPGRKVGGTDQAIRSLFEVLSQRYG
jgi:leucyl aminopeptidase